MKNETLALKREIGELRMKVRKIEHMLEENYELSTWAKKELEKARATPKQKYIRHEQMLREFSLR